MKNYVALEYLTLVGMEYIFKGNWDHGFGIAEHHIYIYHTIIVTINVIILYIFPFVY